MNEPTKRKGETTQRKRNATKYISVIALLVRRKSGTESSENHVSKSTQRSVSVENKDVLVGNAVWSNSQVSRSETIVGLLARQFAWNWISLYFSLFLPLPVSYSSTQNAIYPARSIQYRSVCLPPPVSTASRNSGLADFLVPRLEELSSGIVMAHAS